MTKKTLVIYHASCPDGFGAAYAAWRKFGDRAEYLPTPHSAKPITAKDKAIYFLDFTYKPEVMRRLAKTNRVTVVDHHVSAKESAAAAHESLFDLKHSGAYLAWKYFHPGKKVPRILLHIEDEDIWRFKLPHTAAVNARLELLEFDFKQFDKVIRGFERAAFRKQFIAEGKLLQAYRSRVIRRIVKENVVPVRFMGRRVLAVNGAKPFTSEIGHALYEKMPPMAIVWHERRDRIVVSLRSNNKVDVSKIAKKFGGGGHKGAAAFYLPLNSKKPWTYEKTGKNKRK